MSEDVSNKLLAGFWVLFWAAFLWASYRYVLNRLLRLIYARIGIPPEENARRLGLPALAAALLAGFRLGSSLAPAPQSVYFVVDAALIALAVILCVRIAESLAIDAWLVQRRSARIPRLLRDIVKFLVYLTAFMTIAHQRYGLNVMPLLTTSAVFTMVMGLAMQDTLGNVFAGLASSIDQQYKLDDWITVDNFRGRVVAISWRSTVIENSKGERITIPNNVLGKTRVVVHARWPRGIHKEDFRVRVSHLVPAQRVQRILLKAVADIPYIEKEPAPSVTVGEPETHDVPYVLAVSVKDGVFPPVRTDVPIRIWYGLARENIVMGANVCGDGPPSPPEAQIDTPEEIQDAIRTFRRVDFLASLGESDLEALAKRSLVRLYSSGEYLFRQGDEGSTFYIVKNGKVGVIVRNDAGENVTLTTLESGAYFGEMSLLTGARRSATIQTLSEAAVLAITHDAFKALLGIDPSVADRISLAIAERHLHTQRELSAKQAEAAAAVNGGASQAASKAKSKLLKNIRSFFQLT